MEIRKAEIGDLNAIIDIYINAIDEMNRNNIYQWDEIYPSSELLEEDIRSNQMYIGIKDGIIVSAIVINDDYDDEYEDGEWKYEGRYAVIHRLCVNPVYQNQKTGRNTMLMIENMLKEDGIQAIRLDAFSQNPYALKMYETLGYQKVGEANWRKGLFFLFEKKL